MNTQRTCMPIANIHSVKVNSDSLNKHLQPIILHRCLLCLFAAQTSISLKARTMFLMLMTKQENPLAYG